MAGGAFGAAYGDYEGGSETKYHRTLAGSQCISGNIRRCVRTMAGTRSSGQSANLRSVGRGVHGTVDLDGCVREVPGIAKLVPGNVLDLLIEGARGAVE